MNFDVIVGNPPYQSQRDSGNYSLWPKFVNRSVQLLDDCGYMTMVLPQSWASNELNPTGWVRDVATVRRDSLLLGRLVTVDFTVGNYFEVASSFCSILWQKMIKGLTEVITNEGSYVIDYSIVPWLPVTGNKITIGILNKTVWHSEKKVEQLINDGKEVGGYRISASNVSESKSAEFIWPIINTSAQYTKEKYLYSSVPHPYQSYKKVIFSVSGYTSAFYDDGKFGLSHHSRGIEVESKDHAESVISAINSKLMRYIANTKPSTGNVVGIAKVIECIFKLPYAMNDIQVYNYFGLTQMEIDHVDNNVVL